MNFARSALGLARLLCVGMTAAIATSLFAQPPVAPPASAFVPPVPGPGAPMGALALPAPLPQPLPPGASVPNPQPVQTPLPDDSEFQAVLNQQQSLWDRCFRGKRPPTLPDVAHVIDALDHDLFEVGAIDVKTADVWGQNRMTKFRVEYEKEMAKNLPNFRAVLSARERQADSATLTSATAIGAAVSTSSQRVSGGSTVTNVQPPAAPINLINTTPGANSTNPQIGPSLLLGAPAPVIGYVPPNTAVAATGVASG